MIFCTETLSLILASPPSFSSLFLRRPRQLNNAMSAPRTAAAPILNLFRDIMRIHRIKLAGPLRDIGDDYVRHEFRNHLRGKTTQDQWHLFVEQWRGYLSFVGGTADSKTPVVNTSGDLSEEVWEAMSPDQRKRMELLRAETKHFSTIEEGDPSNTSSGKGQNHK